MKGEKQVKKVRFISVLIVLTVLLLGTTSLAAAAQGVNNEKSCTMSLQQVNEVTNLLKQACSQVAQSCSFERKQLFDDVYEYSIILKVGKGEFDKIRVHRVVKERAPFVPIKTEKAIMLVHGDTSDFRTAFLPTSTHKPVKQSLAGFLAANNLDVWGIDLRWTMVPDQTTDFSFMKNWNTELHLKDIQCAVKFARLLRTITNCGSGQMLMLGHSRGAQYCFAYANMETKYPSLLRDIKGIIPLDLILKIAPENEQMKEAAEIRYQVLKEKYDSGIYCDNEGATMKYVAGLARTAPEEMSPVIPYLTNKQVATLLLTATHATFEPPLEPFTPYYHLNAGTFDENQLPTGFQFVDLDYLIDIALSVPSYQSISESMECEAMKSGVVDVPYDDHFSKIKIPVLYVGAGGGEGQYGQYVLSQIGSTDKEVLMVQLYPAEYAVVDYGHADLIWADNAQALVWEPILSWIANH